MAHVLIADDDEEILVAIAACLEAEGHTVTFARHGGDALDKIRSAAALPDVALVDWRMPVLDGLAVLRALREDSALRDLPCVLMSAEEVPLRDPRVRFLKKPFGIDRLTGLVAALAERAPSLAEAGR